MMLDDMMRDGNSTRSNANNTGHGHVRPRPDGMKARCGGPAICGACARERDALPDPASPPLVPATPRRLIAFTGLAGSGKSTAAAHLVSRGWQRVRFAGPLKAMMAALGCTVEEIDGALKETPCDLLGGKTPRYAMQTIGTEWGRDLIAPDIWIRAWNAALAKVPAGAPVVVDDCRFPNEAEAVHAASGFVVRIDRPGAGTASVHSSEQHDLPADAVICNHGDFAALHRKIDQLSGLLFCGARR